MNNAPLIFSILFFIGCFIYSFLGIYILHIDSKSVLNRVFFALSVSLGIWAFGFSIAVSAPDEQTALIWRRVAAIGWGSMYSILLHFSMIITGRKALIKKWWGCALVYLPAIVSVFAFAVFEASPDKLINTSLGWINVEGYGAWDWFFNVYYCGFVIAVLLLVLNWGRRAQNMAIKKQSRTMAYTLIAAFVLGTVTDIVGYPIFSVALPQLSPVIILIPVSAIFYSIRKYRLMKPKPESEDEAILSSKARVKVYNYLAAGFIAGGFLNFISQYLIFGDSLEFVLVNSAILMAFGAASYVVQRLRLGRNTRNIINIAVITAAIPVVTFRFSQYSGLTVWALPFVLLIIALTFNKRTMLVSIAVSAVLTQVYLWFVYPQQGVVIDGGNYIGRIGIFTIASWIAMHVNKVYRMRIKENAAQIRFQKLVSEISTEFLNVTEVDLGEAIDNMLQKAGEFFEADTSYLYFYDVGSKRMGGSYLWRSEDTGAQEHTVGDLHDALPWIMGQINERKSVYIHNVKELPPEAEEECRFFERTNVCSSIIVPIEYQDSVLGFLGFESRENGRWREKHIDLLRILTNISAEALIKVDSEIRIKQMAYFDNLTGLPNRTLFMDRITQAIHQAKRSGKMVGVIFLDLDDFKNVNDTMGHLGGDELLCKIAQKLSDTVRKSDTVSRFGGDEFLIMINDIKSLEDIVGITENLMTHFNKPFTLRGQEFFITASAGVTLYPIDGADPEKLIKNADIAMYKAKEKGKSQYVLCSSEMKEEVNKKVKLTSLLYHALDNDELMLYYQPQVCLKTNTIIGLEALLRWKHPKLGMIYPNAFIPLAEQTGLINPIGEWVLRTACIQNKAWQDIGLPTVRMGVNTSVYQFRNPNFIDLIESVLDETRLSPKDLELEITESMIMKESDTIVDILGEIKKLGIIISIDDFGTEYSSLSRLKMLPIDRIKMDMQFVHGIEKSDKDKAITKVIISLAQNLGVKVVAEGVETEKQMQFLSMRMCDEVQGFYCYRPMPAGEVESILRQSMLEGKVMGAGM